MSEHFVRCVICEMIVPTEKTFVRDTGLTAGLEYTCIDCMNKEDNHQQRLDKVLGRMNKNDKTNYDDFQYYLYLGKTGITLDYDSGKFYLEDNDLYTIQISLDTVEHLIADMEAQDE